MPQVFHKQTIVQAVFVVADEDGNCSDRVAQVTIEKFDRAEFAKPFGELDKARQQLLAPPTATATAEPSDAPPNRAARRRAGRATGPAAAAQLEAAVNT